MESEKMVESVKGLLTRMFNDLKEVPATLFAFDGKDLGIIPVGHLMEDKEFAAAAIDKVRRDFPLVFFATEVWMVQREEKEEGLVPSECEDREEKLMLFAYEGNSIDMYQADILRSGSLLELREWKKNELGNPEGRFCRPLQPDPRMN